MSVAFSVCGKVSKFQGFKVTRLTRRLSRDYRAALMKLLTLSEARVLTEQLRCRWSGLCKLAQARQRDWYTRHPEVIGRLERIHQLQDELGEGGLAGDLTAREERLRDEMKLLCDELEALPKCPAGLTEDEANELHNVMSQFQKLRQHLPKAV